MASDRDTLADIVIELRAIAAALISQADIASRAGQSGQLRKLQDRVDTVATALGGWRPPARVITDPDSLEARREDHPPRSLATDGDGEAWISIRCRITDGVGTRHVSRWRTLTHSMPCELRDVVADHGPVTLVHVPGEVGRG